MILPLKCSRYMVILPTVNCRQIDTCTTMSIIFSKRAKSGLVVFSLGDVFGYLALTFVTASTILIARKNLLIRKRLLRGPLSPKRHLRRRRIRGRLLYLTNLGLLRRAHAVMALLGGFFLVLHVAYLISYPVNDAIVLGYVAGAVALFIGLTGTSYLQKFREARFFHGSIALAAIALMATHAIGSGFNLPIWMSVVALLATASVAFAAAVRNVWKML